MYRKGSVVLYVVLLGLSILLAVQLETFGPKDTGNNFAQDDVSGDVSFVEAQEELSQDTEGEEVVPPAVVNEDVESREEYTQKDELVTSEAEVIADALDEAGITTGFEEVVSVQPEAVTSEPLIIPEKYISHGQNALEADEIIYHTNIQRAEYGLTELSQNSALMQAATGKINDMFDGQYFEHVAPDGKDVMYWADEVGYAYILVGENLAMGNFKDEETMVQAWMESPGHRENILKPSYDEIGVAVGKGMYSGNEVWMGVQIFGTPLSACPTIDHSLVTMIEAKQAIIDSLEIQIDVRYPEVSNYPQPQTQDEYDTYILLVDAYNELVKQHADAVEHITEMIAVYNDQVQSYNTCIASK